MDVLENWEVDPQRFSMQRDGDGSSAKWALIAAKLRDENLVPVAPASLAVKKRLERLMADALGWLVRAAATPADSQLLTRSLRRCMAILTRCLPAARRW